MTKITIRHYGPLIYPGNPISLEELARSQNVLPLADVRALFNTWPGEEDDGFEATIDELRHPTQKGATTILSPAPARGFPRRGQ